ncbi:hypothetical protein [Acinetobacter modestus]|jgi:hypothetical protein
MTNHNDFDYEQDYEENNYDEQDFDPDAAHEADLLEKQESGYFGSDFDN